MVLDEKIKTHYGTKGENQRYNRHSGAKQKILGGTIRAERPEAAFGPLGIRGGCPGAPCIMAGGPLSCATGT